MNKFIYSINVKHIAAPKPLFLFIVLVIGFVLKVQISGYSQTVIGGNTPDPSAILDVQSNSKGVLFPRMTAIQRDYISSPVTGLMIFNTDIQSLEINLGTPTSPNWQIIIRGPGTVATIECNSFRLVGPFLKSTVAASGNSVRIPYTGGNGGLHNGQTVTSTGVTGLTATFSTGSFATGADSLTYEITGTPASSGLASFALNIGGQTCTLNVPVDCGAYVSQGQWKVFSCYNLGAANTSADPFTPSWEINGGYWQWGIAAQAAPGPTGVNGGTPNEGLPGTWTPAGSSWNTTPAVNGAWLDASKTSDDPCPMGFRVPTSVQWQGVRNTTLNKQTNAAGSSWSASATNYSSGKNFGLNLMLPAAGYRNNLNGRLADRGLYGDYWSSTISSSRSVDMSFTSLPASMFVWSRTYAFSIRCIAE